MYENLIQNWVQAIPWGDFWEPVTFKQKCIKWSVILLMLILSISIFLLKLDDIQTFEYACENPIIVEAERNVVEKHYWLTGGAYYEIYASYSYNGVSYEDIFYRTSKNPGIQWDGVETITIAVAPNNPGIPVRHMFDEGPVLFAMVLWSLGLASLIYGTALEFPKFREWRVTCTNRPGFFSRPYGKPKKTTEHPDYLKDAVFIWLPIYIIFSIILGFTFPNTFT